MTLACRLQSVEEAQKQFKTVKNASAAHVPDRDNSEEPGNSRAVASFSSIEKLSSQVEQLTKTVAELTARSKERRKPSQGNVGVANKLVIFNATARGGSRMFKRRRMQWGTLQRLHACLQ